MARQTEEIGMTDAQVAVPSSRPEYTAEQVDSAKIQLAGVAAMNMNAPIQKVISVVLSALSTAEADTKRLDWVLNNGARWTCDGTSTDRDGHWYTVEWDFGGVAEGLSLREAVDAGIAKHTAEHGTRTAARKQEGVNAK